MYVFVCPNHIKKVDSISICSYDENPTYNEISKMSRTAQRRLLYCTNVYNKKTTRIKLATNRTLNGIMVKK